jgi:hypothetical protein
MKWVIYKYNIIFILYLYLYILNKIYLYFFIYITVTSLYMTGLVSPLHCFAIAYVFLSEQQPNLVP